MKLIIAGGRDLNVSHHFIEDAYNYHFPVKEYLDYPKEIVSGKSGGIDTCGEEWANVISVKVIPFPYLSEYGKAGGPIRNRKMAKYADALLLIWDGKSKGSAAMKKEMEKLEKPIYEVILIRRKL